jgi:hypothetical protein
MIDMWGRITYALAVDCDKCYRGRIQYAPTTLKHNTHHEKDFEIYSAFSILADVGKRNGFLQ